MSYKHAFLQLINYYKLITIMNEWRVLLSHHELATNEVSTTALYAQDLNSSRQSMKIDFSLA